MVDRFHCGSTQAGKLCVSCDKVGYGGTVYSDKAKEQGEPRCVQFWCNLDGVPAALEMRTPAFKTGTRVLVIDQATVKNANLYAGSLTEFRNGCLLQWVETGSTMTAAVELVERQQGVVAGIVAVNIEDNEATQKLRARYKCHSVAAVGRGFAAQLLPLEATPDIAGGAI